MDKNRICDLLGIRYPIIQAPMNWVSGADLAATVSSAGGLGTLGPNAGADNITPDVDVTGERMRDQIRKVKSRTGNPFAINITVGFGERTLYSQKIVEVSIEEGVPVAIVSVGKPDVYTKKLKQAGMKVLHAVSTARHAKNAERAGVDGVICEGFEAGGHKGFTELTSFVLIPMVSEAVQIPVVAGGGIGDARGVIAAMALGADGVYMGTRFMATKESDSHPDVKDQILKGEDVCTVSLPKDKMLARDLSNDFAGTYLEMKRAGAPSQELNAYLDEHSQFHAQHLGRAADAEICCGQVAGLVTDIRGADDIVSDIAGSIRSHLEGVKQKMNDFLQ